MFLVPIIPYAVLLGCYVYSLPFVSDTSAHSGDSDVKQEANPLLAEDTMEQAQHEVGC